MDDPISPYALGLWCADGYWWSSSIGLSNVEPELLRRFGTYLLDRFPKERLFLRVYLVEKDTPDQRLTVLTDNISIRPAHKMVRTAYHLYVNSRPLLRTFRDARTNLPGLDTHLLGRYFAGRFDGDGSWGDTPRIAYSTSEEASVDQSLLRRAGVTGTSVFWYAQAHEHCLYVQRRSQDRFRNLMSDYSWKLGLDG